MSDWQDDRREWLEADGRGGFASGTVSGIRTRRYHGLLLTAMTPPTGRVMLVNGFDAWVATTTGRHAISSQRYALDVIHPHGVALLHEFRAEPWPTWAYALPDGTRVQQELWVPHGRAAVVLTWRLMTEGDAGPVQLIVRPFLSGRDYHSMHHENGGLDPSARHDGPTTMWRPYPGLPWITSRANADYEHAPDWYRNVRYEQERARGLDDTEDVWAPGWLTFNLSEADACWWLEATPEEAGDLGTAPDPVVLVGEHRSAERARRAAFASPLHRAADAYIVRRRQGATIVAGYPWFTEWGRDTFIALRGLCLQTGRLEIARDILVEWADAVSDGMLPNRFPDAGDAPEYNAVDASLWFVLAAVEYLEAVATSGQPAPAQVRAALRRAVDDILSGYAGGTRFGIRLDADSLLACGVPGVQLTWMDAKVGDEVVTPRIGKPVEVQALWINALDAATSEALESPASSRWRALSCAGRKAFADRFWNEATSCLFDVVDVDHQSGSHDEAIRPNQIFAVGGLRLALLDPGRERAVVEVVQRHLLTPLGLRSLAPGSPGYTPHYEGDSWARDHAYHQGTVWPWLMYAFVDAWLRVYGDDDARREEARSRFLTPLLAHLGMAGIGHVSEIADAEPPYEPNGCPFQAWSMGELLRLDARLSTRR